MSRRRVPVALLLALAVGLAGACSGPTLDDEVRAATGEPDWEQPAADTHALVFARGSDREKPTDQIVVVGTDGLVHHELSIEPALVRLRSTASPDHVIVLTRAEGQAATDVDLLDVTAGTLDDVELPAGDWEVIRLLGTPTVHPATVAVLIDEVARRIGILDVATNMVTVVEDVPDADVQGAGDVAPPALRTAPTGDAALLTLPDGARIVSAIGTTRRLTGPGEDFTFVRWLGDGRGIEYVRTWPGEDGVLYSEPLVGTQSARVRIGTVDASLPTRSGLVLVQNRTVYVAGREGARELHTGAGPFVLPVASDGAGGQVLIFDGAGGGFRHDLVNTDTGEATGVDLPTGANIVPGATGGDVIWLASGDGVQPVLTLDLTTGNVVETLHPPADQSVDPTLVRPSPTGQHALARVGTSLTALALRVLLLNADGSDPVELAQGRNADGIFSPDGNYVAVTWDPVEDPIDRLGRVAIHEVQSGTTTDLGPGHEPVWAGA